MNKNTLFQNLIEINNYIDIPKNYDEVLSNARKARNIVAHDLTSGLEHTFVKTEKEDELEKTISKLSREIIEGELLVITIVNLITKEQIPNKKYLSNKIEWIINLV